MVRICCPVTFALLVTLPGFSFADRLEDLLNQQKLAYSRLVAQSFPQNNIQMPSQQLLGLSGQQLASQQMPYAQAFGASPYLAQQNQQLLGLSGQQLASQQMPYAQGLGASPYLAQQNAASMEATISNLQTQIAAERTNEVQLVNVIGQKQQELQKENASFARILTLVETGAEQEHELRRLLTSAKAKNEGLQEEALQNEGEVSKWRDEAKEAEQQVKQSAFLQKRAEHVMQDVRLAQAKVRRSEEIIHSLLPRLQPQPRVEADAANLRLFLSKAGPRVAGGQDIQGASSQEVYEGA